MEPLIRPDCSVRRAVMQMKRLCKEKQLDSFYLRDLCRKEKCTEVCIREELGEDGEKKACKLRSE